MILVHKLYEQHKLGWSRDPASKYNAHPNKQRQVRVLQLNFFLQIFTKQKLLSRIRSASLVLDWIWIATLGEATYMQIPENRDRWFSLWYVQFSGGRNVFFLSSTSGRLQVRRRSAKNHASAPAAIPNIATWRHVWEYQVTVVYRCQELTNHG
jgi:hypothetical protein